MASPIQESYEKVVPSINTGVQSSRASSDTAKIASDPMGKAHKAAAQKVVDEEAAKIAAQQAAAKAVTDQAAYDKALAGSQALTAKYSAPAPAAAAPTPAATGWEASQQNYAESQRRLLASEQKFAADMAGYNKYPAYQNLLAQYNQIMGTNYTAL